MNINDTMKKIVYQTPLAELVEVSNEENLLVGSNENMNTENIGTVSGNW